MVALAVQQQQRGGESRGGRMHGTHVRPQVSETSGDTTHPPCLFTWALGLRGI